jgi:hypothetical protein
MLEKYEVCCGVFHGFDWTPWAGGTARQRLSLVAGAQEHILALERGKERLMLVVSELSQALCAGGARSRGDPHPRRCGLLPGGARGAG